MKSEFVFGVIGGNGEMGKSLRKFLQKFNQKILWSDIGTEVKNTEVVEKSDIVIIATPVNRYENLFLEIKDFLSNDKLVMDIGSLKMKQVEIMKKYHSGEILATHPLFGPEKNFYGSENTIIVHKINPSVKTEFVLSLFKKNKLNIIEMSPDKHDKIMAYIHGFYYLNNLAYLKLLKNEFGSIKSLEKIMTTSFSKYISTLNNIFNTKDWLIEFICYENPEIENIIEKYKKILNEKIDVKEIRKFL